MGRKKKPTRKYKPRNEFRYNNSYSGGGHPNYVFGETDTKYKSLSLTHSPDEKYRYVKLQNNPDSKDERPAYLELKPKTAKKSYYTESNPDMQFSKSDMSIVRQTIKRYKKSTNKKPKNWYIKKAKWKKEKKDM